MMKAFNLSDIITDPDLLFGRNKPGQVLSKMLVNVLRGESLQLCGERRSGKTSTLKCFQSILENKHSSRYVPIYLNFKETPHIKGDSDTYRYILTKIVSTLMSNGILKEGDEFQNIRITPPSSFNDIYEKLIRIDVNKIRGLLTEKIELYSSYFEKTIILLIDEYEYLFKYTLNSPDSFFPLRTISEKSTEEGYKMLQYIISGSQTWNKIGNDIGSPVLNSLGAGILYLSPLSKDDFYEMWNYYFPNNVADNPDLYNKDYIFDLSGGIPYYAKIIGNAIISGDEINYNLLEPHFDSLLNRLTQNEKRILQSISLETEHVISPAVNHLNKLGLIRKINDKLTINGKLFQNYLIDRFKEILNSNYSSFTKDLDDLIKKIIQKITSINKTARNKIGTEIFLPTIEDQVILIDLQTPCIDSEDLIRFTSALYKTLFERTREKKNLDRLPKAFRSNHKTVILIGESRHHFGGHLTYSPTYKAKITRGELLEELISSKNDPLDEDFIKIQLKLLDLFNKYLIEINEFIRNNTDW